MSSEREDRATEGAPARLFSMNQGRGKQDRDRDPARSDVVAPAGGQLTLVVDGGAESKLRESEIQFDLLAQSTGAGVVQFSLDGEALFVNDTAARMVRSSPDRLLGRSFVGLLGEVESRQLLTRLGLVATSGRAEHFEDEVLLPSGERRWFLSTYSPVADLSGGTIGIQVVSLDITDRKEADQRLRESEERFYIAFYANPAMSTITDLETGKLVEANSAWLQAMGFDREEAIGRSVAELGIISAAERAAMVDTVKESEQTRVIEVALTTKSGLPLTVLWSGEVISLQGHRCVLAAALDITQRKDLEESLLLAQYCVDNAGEAIFAFAPDGRILYANQSAHELYGYDPEEMPSLTVFDLDPDLTAGTWSSLWGPAGTSISSLTANPRKKNGERFLAEVSISYVQYGERVQSFTFVRDVTARRQAEEARRISENRFRQMFQSISSGFVVYEAVNQGEDFVVAEFNAAAERITRIAKDEAIGRSIADLFPGVRALGLLEVVRRVWASGVAETLPASEYRDARLNVWVENFVYRLPSGEVCAVFDDVTEKWQALQGLQSAYDHLWHARIGTLQALGAITEFRDPYTAGHQRRVAKIAVAIGRRLGLSSHELEGLHAAAIVHDIGKIAVPIEILSSPAILNDGQLEMVHEHVTAGYEILRTIDFEWPVADIVRQHHERLDGSGYPRGLQGREILREALILGVADMFEAMISHRPYRAALGKDVALRELVAGSGVLYDAPAVAALMEIDFDAELQADEPHPMSPRPQLLSIAAPLD